MINLFQTQDYLSFLKNTALQPFSYSISENGIELGRIQGYVQKDGGPIKRFLSRRAIINGGPFLKEDITEEGLTKLIMQCVNNLKRSVIYIEIRNFADYSGVRPIFEKCGFIYEPHYDFIINTETMEVAENNLGKSRKRDIKSSLNKGATIIENPSEEQVVSFYLILRDLYKKRVKTPLFPIDFFLTLYHSCFCRFLLVSYQQEIIGGTVCVFDDNTVYEWFACGKDGTIKSVFPSTLATWAGIRFAAQSGRKVFDMMGAGAPGDGGYGVRDFKAKFGGELVEYGRFKYICNKTLYKIGEIGVNLLKKHSK